MAEEEEVVEEEIEEDEPVASDGAAAESAGEDVKALASAVAAKATEDAFFEIPVTAEGAKEDEKTEDQVTEIEEDKQNMGARVASLDEVRDIPIEESPASPGEAEESIVEASVVEDISEAKSEPPVEEAKETSPPTRKKVTVEESPPPSPVKKEESPGGKEPSWWKKSKQPEEETIEAESVEEQKSKSEAAPEPEPEPEPAKAEPEPEPTKAEPEPEPAKAEPEPEPEPEPAKAEPEPEPEEAKEPSVREETPKPAQQEYFEVPVASEPAPEEESKVTIEPAEEAARREVSPPQERLSRRDRAEHEERPVRAPVDTSYTASTPIARTPTYVTYSSWAPASDYRSAYIPAYSAYLRPSTYYQSDVASPYVRPVSAYVRQFDSYVRTGPFGQSSYATDRARTRSHSRGRSHYSYSGYYTPQPLRRNREYSLPSRYAQASGPPSSAPSRSGSFVNFMDYIVNTDRNLRRSISRTSSFSEEAAPVSRSVSRTILPTPADTINYWYTKQIEHVGNYVSRLNRVYDNNVYGYTSRYNTSRPYTGYLTAGLGDHSTYSRSLHGYSSNLERRLATHKTYLAAYDLTRLPRTAARQDTMKRSVFW